MTGLWDSQAMREGASLAPAPAPPATIGERAEIDWRVFRDQQMLDSAELAEEDAYLAYADELQRLTGQRIKTPAERFIERRGNTSFGIRPERDRAAARESFDADLAALAQKFPDVPVKARDDILAEIGVARAEQRRQQADVVSRTIDWPVSVAGYGATAAAAMTEPMVIASMGFGAPFSAGILRTALIEGGIGIASEVPIQLGVQAKRRRFGEEASFSEGLMSVLAAGGGGFLFGGLLRAAGKAPGGIRALLQRSRELPESLRTADVRAAETYLERVVEADDARPFPDTPYGRAAHAERLAEAERALREGQPADLPPARQRVVERPTGGAAAETPVEQAAQDVRTEALRRADLDERTRAVVDALVPMLTDDDAVSSLLGDLRAKPARVESLLGYLHRTGGIVDERGELAALGLTPLTRPGLLRKSGRDLDTAALQAQEQGFFPNHDLEAGDRVTVNEFLDAIDEELRGNLALRADDVAVDLRNRALGEIREGLAAAGIDAARITPERFRQQVADLARGGVAERERGAELARMARAGADAAEIEERLAMMAEEDLLDEADVLRRYEGRVDEVIAIEDEDGVRRLSVRQMLDELRRDEDDFAALRACVTGGARG